MDPDATREEINTAWKQQREDEEKQREAEEKQREAEERRQQRIQEIFQNKSLTKEEREIALAAFVGSPGAGEIKGS